MATRLERVVLELDDRFSAPTARAAAQARLLQRSLDDVGGSSALTSTQVVRTERDISTLGQTASKSGADINQFSGRLGLAARAVAAIGPAAVPIAAVAVPAVAGLSSALGVTVLAAGTAVFALQGVGDTLDALNKAQLKPTAENIAAANAALEALSPRAQEFVDQIRQVAPAFTELRDTAAAGLFPGLLDGLNGVMAVLPQVSEFMGRMGDSLGRLGEMTGDSLRSGEWGDFLSFLTQTAPPAIESLGRSVGDLSRGLADLWMAFDPLNTSVIAGLENSAQAFADWSAGLAETEGFQEFVAYLQQTVPQVGETLGALGNAVLQIVEAIAPLGGPSLRIIEALADALGAIADSPIGTPLLAMVAAMSALSLATRGYASARKAAFGSDAAAGIRGTVNALTTVTSAQERAQSSASKLAATERARRREALAGAGKQAALLGGLAIASSGFADSAGLANTANLALWGGLAAGPIGAAAGGAIGFIQDLTAANNDLEESLVRAEAKVKAIDLTPGSVRLAQTEIDATQKKIDEYANTIDQLQKDRSANPFDFSISNPKDVLAGFKNNVEGLFGDSDLEEAQAQLQRLQEETDQAGEASTRAEAKAHLLKVATLGVSDAAGLTARGMLDLAEQQNIAAEQAEKAAERMKKLRDAAKGTAGSFFDLGDSLNDSKVSLGEWIKEMETQAAALRDFTANSVKAADKGLASGLVASLRSAGPEGALRLKELANATEDEIERANRAWRKGQRAIDEYVDTATGVKDPTLGVDDQATATLNAVKRLFGIVDGTTAKPSVRADIGNSIPLIGSVQAAINRVQGKTVTLTTIRRTVQEGGNGGFGPQSTAAGGGSVPKDGKPYADRFLYMLAPGEEIISNRFGQADAFRADRAAGRIPGYAGGGTTGAKPGPGPRYAWDDSAGARAAEFPSEKAANRALKALQHQVDGMTSVVDRASVAFDRAADAVDAEVAARESLQQQYESLSSSIGGNYASALFGAGGDAWRSGQGSDPLSVLRADIARAQGDSALTSNLQGRGLSGAALTYAAGEGTDALQNLVSMTDDQLREYGSLFAQRKQEAAAFGNQVAQQELGQAIAAQDARLAETNALAVQAAADRAVTNERLALLEQAVRQQEKTVEAVGDRQERATDRMGSSVARGQRNRRTRRN